MINPSVMTGLRVMHNATFFPVCIISSMHFGRRIGKVLDFAITQYEQKRKKKISIYHTSSLCATGTPYSSKE